MTTKFLDTFTDVDGTFLEDHSPDFPLGVSWLSIAGYQEIQSNKVQSAFGPQFPDAHTLGAGIEYAIGDDIYCDITRNPDGTGFNNGIMFCLATNNYGLWVDIVNLDAASVGFHLRRYEGITTDEIEHDNPNMPSLPLTLGQTVRLGITILEAQLFRLWWEPEGGGTRTQIVLNDGGTYTDGNGYWVTSADLLDDPAYSQVGITFTANGAGQCQKDNLTVTGLEPTLPVIKSQLSYQRILNVARGRSKDFLPLVLDDMQVIDELNAITLEIIEEATDADHTSFQEVVNWATDVLPALDDVPAPTDLRDVDDIWLPSWVNTIFAAEGVRSNSKIEIHIERKETEIRNRIPDQSEGFGYYAGLIDQRLQYPRAYKVWDSTNSVWRLYKDLAVAGGPEAWADIIDANLVVAGVRFPMLERADMTSYIPAPFRALRPLAEAYALILGSRTNKSQGWMQQQMIIKDKSWERFREWVNGLDMSRDEAFDPEIGQDLR